MAFSESTIREAWNKARGKCQKCGKILKWNPGNTWHAHHIHAASKGGHDGLSNCKILCKNCHKNTSSYGG